MFGTKDAIIRLDMSEFSDRTAVSKLIGTTAGYVGYDDNNNTLTERVRRNPYSIILLDEIEKADPQVITLLLQVLDDGQAAKDYITEEGYDEVMGVRPLRRVIEQEIRDKVTDFHLDHLDAKHLEADMEDGVLVIREKA